MAWDPKQYLKFADHRARPGLELLARIDHDDPATIVDLGSGPGNLTALLADRWPEAELTGVDSSAEMVTRARADYPDIHWIEADLTQWEPDGPIDVIYSNATLHWLDNHDVLFPRLRSCLAPGGVLAVQMPDNWRAPTHRVPAEILDNGSWPDKAVTALMRDRLSPAAHYRRWLQPGTVDMWRTTYFQELQGPDAVWNWVTGSVLRPVLAELDGTDQVRFGEACRTRYTEAYPEEEAGITLLPFSRLFLIVSAPG